MIKVTEKIKEESLLVQEKAVWMRIIQLEYRIRDEEHPMDDETVKQEIRRIYREEMGVDLPANISLLRSEKAGIHLQSSYVGTAIRLQNSNKETNELYIVSQGSQTLDDWGYNFIELYGAQGGSQYEDTVAFTEAASQKLVYGMNKSNRKKTIQSELGQLSTIALGHSLADNNNTNARLIDGVFDEVYGVNGAPPNAYQLGVIDRDFRNLISRKYGIDRNDFFAIHSIPHDEITQFAKEYYEAKGVTEGIYKDVSENDMLHFVSDTGGFFLVGDVQTRVTNPALVSLRQYVEHIPDEDARRIRMFFASLGEAYHNGGVETAVADWLGLDLEFLQEIDGITSGLAAYFVRGHRLDAMIENMGQKLPDALENIRYILKHKDVIFDTLVKGGYIDERQKATIITELESLEQDLLHIQELSVNLADSRQLSGFALVGADAAGVVRLLTIANRMKNSGETIYTHLEQTFIDIKSGHSIGEMLNAMEQEKGKVNGIWREYTAEGVDVIYHKVTDTDAIKQSSTWHVDGLFGGNTISVNMSSISRIYHFGIANIEEHQTLLNRYEATFYDVIDDDYEHRKRTLLHKIDDMEANPSSYQHLVKHPHPKQALVRITVNEHIMNKPNVSHDVIAGMIYESIQEKQQLIEQMRRDIEELFRADERVAAMFMTR